MENENKIEEIHQLVDNIQAQIAKLRQMLDTLVPADMQRAVREKAAEFGSIGGTHSGTIIEGVFDGQNMVGPDGKIYTVPANYASKSKIVEGDILKLTIKEDGTFMYKQIGPVERKRLVATLVRDDTTRTFRAVTNEGKSFRLLLASVTYYKGEPNDDVVILVPSSMDSRWAAVENIVQNMSDEERRHYEEGEDESGEDDDNQNDENNTVALQQEHPHAEDIMLDDGRRHTLPSGDEDAAERTSLQDENVTSSADNIASH